GDTARALEEIVGAREDTDQVEQGLKLARLDLHLRSHRVARGQEGPEIERGEGRDREEGTLVVAAADRRKLDGEGPEGRVDLRALLVARLDLARVVDHL